MDLVQEPPNIRSFQHNILLSFSHFPALDSFGVRLVHGVIPGTEGTRSGCLVAEVFPGSRADFHGEIYEGDEVLDINGIRMDRKSTFDIKQIVNSIRDEAELVCRR